MPLAWNEIRSRARNFSKKWEKSGYEKGETHLFYSDFFQVFGVPILRVASFEEPVLKLGEKRGYIDLFWKGVLMVEQKSAGGNLRLAKDQALNYFPGLKDNELPRYILVSDFQTFVLHDLEDQSQVSFSLPEFHEHIEEFGFIIGAEKRAFKDQDPVNIQAAQLVGKLHDSLEASGYVGHDLERFLVRIVFCLFADDTGIFDPRGKFVDLLEKRTSVDGSDLGGWLTHLFETLNTPVDKRQTTLDEELTQFPHVNGELFREHLHVPAFNSEMRERLIDACRFDWTAISPAIFGSLFQSVMDRKERRRIGAHYTTEKNILKVIEPLFLTNLRNEFNSLKKLKDRSRGNSLLRFQEKLAALKFLDPACGCGNFLVIAYRELRMLETEVIKEIHKQKNQDIQLSLDVSQLTLLNVGQFYGIEISEFPVRIAKTALWMMYHLMNNYLSMEFGQSFVRLSIEISPSIIHADALETDWADFLPPEECDFILGNPPFIGAKVQNQSQRNQVHRINRTNGTKQGTLDYVCAWFILAGSYMRKGNIRLGLVATSSISQGEQVAQLWPLLLEEFKLEISFAHRPFAWQSDAPGKAQVEVVIIGLDKQKNAPKNRSLFSYPSKDDEPFESQHKVISPYLFDADSLKNPHIVVRNAKQPLNNLPKMKIGSKPVDGRNFIFNEQEKSKFLESEPAAEKFFRPFVGTEELLNDSKRWILALQNRVMPFKR